MLVVDGAPVPNPRTTGNLLVGTTIGRWLASHNDVVHGTLVDVGCGNRPYADWYEPKVDHYLALDPAAGADGPNIRAMADQLPVKDRCADVVLCTEVLEHVERSDAAMAEIARILKSDGHALITVPFLYPTHEAPYDFQRYTHIGLAALVRRHGLQIVDFAAAGGPIALAGSWLFRAMRLPIDLLGRKLGSSGPLSLRAPFRWLIVSPQTAVLRLRGRSVWKLTKAAELVSNGYLVLARKP